MSAVAISYWSECIQSNQTKNIPLRNLDDHIRNISCTFQFPARDLTNECASIIKDLATKCDSRGLTSTIYGDLDKKTKVFGLFHCLLEEDGTVSVSYAIHTVALKVAKQQVQRELSIKTDVQKDELQQQIANDTLAKSAMKTILEMGLDLKMSFQGKEKPLTNIIITTLSNLIVM